MRKEELKRKLEELKNEGFITSLRHGSTGIGFTLETKLGISESNIPIPDIGGTVEIKTTRRGSNSLITLFTFNKAAWRLSQSQIIRSCGYLDENNRPALKSTIFHNRENSLGLLLGVDLNSNRINLNDSSGVLLASWDLYEVVSKFLSKLNKLLFILADRINENGVEKFHYNEAYLLTEPAPRNFISGFRDSKLGIDLRMHLNPNGSVRNRGTGFRIREIDMISLYSRRERLL
jgi:hypothetical protein